jgi:hypothetical protein
MFGLRFACSALDAQFWTSDRGTEWHYLALLESFRASVHQCKSTAHSGRIPCNLLFGPKGQNKEKCNHSIDTPAAEELTALRDFVVNYEHPLSIGTARPTGQPPDRSWLVPEFLGGGSAADPAQVRDQTGLPFASPRPSVACVFF